MANSDTYARRLARIKLTPKREGVEMTIRVVAYKKDYIEINGSPIGRKKTADPALTVSRLMTQMMEALMSAHEKLTRTASKEQKAKEYML